MTTTEKKEITIDAAGQVIGRVATRAAKALMGKTQASYTPHIASKVHVSITNAAKLYMPERKRLSKTYTRYTGYPSGLRKEKLGNLVERKGAGAALRHAIQGMLPRNTLRTDRMKRLSISE